MASGAPRRRRLGARRCGDASALARDRAHPVTAGAAGVRARGSAGSAGDLDISPTTPSPATFNQLTEGFDIQLIAAGPLERQGRMASVWLTVLKDRADQIKQLSDLKGKTIEAGAPGTPFDLAVISAVRA